MTLPKHQREKHKAKRVGDLFNVTFSNMEKEILFSDVSINSNASSTNPPLSETEFDADLAKLEQIALRKISALGKEIETRQKVEVTLTKARSTEILKVSIYLSIYFFCNF